MNKYGKTFKYLQFLVIISLLLAMGSFWNANPAQAASSDALLKYDFGPGAVQSGYTQVLQSTAYSQSLGYGFADVSKVSSRDRGTSDALRSDFCMPAGTPFLVNLPNGDYNLTFISGDAIATAYTQVKAEGVTVALLSSGAGSYAEKTVAVTVKDGQLTLDFVSSVPRINALEISKIYKFDFGPGAVASGYTGVLQTTVYSSSLGYGFPDITKVASRDRGVSDPLESDFCLPAGTPFLVNLPNGTYDVSVLSGDEIGKTSMDVRAEGLLELYSYGAPTAKYIQESFPIKVADGQLQLDFSGSAPHVNALVITRRPDAIVDKRITVFVAGDSTVSTYNEYSTPQAGWGQMLPGFFNDQVFVDDQAKRGRSTKSFYDEGSLDTILSRIKPNDYLLIMFGINDASTDPARHTDPETTFKDYLTKYINAARQHGAIPVLVTSQSKRSYDANGVFYNSIGQYPTAMRELGAALNVPVIDLNKMSIDYYNSIGVEATKNVFLWLDPGEYPNFPNGAQDNVHFQENGATQLARLVTQSIKDLNIQPLADNVK